MQINIFVQKDYRKLHFNSKMLDSPSFGIGITGVEIICQLYFYE